MKPLTKEEWDQLSDEDKWRKYSNLFQMYMGSQFWQKQLEAIILDYQKRFFEGMMASFEEAK